LAILRGRCSYDVSVALPEPGAEFSALVAAVSSAFGDPTRREVYLYARESPIGVTASQVARRFSLHPNVARHHLDKLAAGGYLEVASERGEKGTRRGAGRPSKRYRASGPAPVLGIPKREDELLLALLAGALSLLPDQAAEEMAEQVGFSYGTKLAAAMSPGVAPGGAGHPSFRAALQAVADALTAHGFAAHAEPRGHTLALVKEACPFLEEARQHPVICAVDRGMVKGMLRALSGSEPVPVQWSSRAMGDEACTTCLPAGA
jgi:predicted ArsR family transcriptional regulator